MKQLVLIIFIISIFSLSYATVSPYDAARNGDLNSLRKYRFEGIDLFIPDERGFIPYELVALYANPNKKKNLRKHVETMFWLKEYQSKKHHYGKASISLVQAGLKSLGYFSGKYDGIMGKKTANAIKSFQKDNDIAETGKLGPQWLGLLYQDIVKNIQLRLTSLGFNTYGADGMIGKNTQNAIKKYRSSKKLASPDYPYIDALLLDSVDSIYLSHNNKKISFIQSGLKSLGYSINSIDGIDGKNTENAIRKFQKINKLSVTGKVDKKTWLKMNSMFLKEVQIGLNNLGYKLGATDGKMGKRTQDAIKKYRKDKNIPGVGLDYKLIISIKNNFKSITKNNSVKNDNKKIVIKKNKFNSKSTILNNVNVKGVMSFNRRNGRVISCSITKTEIPIEWCEPFYPLPKNNYCEVTFKPSSREVINLWCK